MNKMRYLAFVLVGLVVLALLVVGTVTLSKHKKREKVDLPFETIERVDSPGTGVHYKDKGPRIVIIAEVAELGKLGNTVSTEAQARLRDLDFDRHFAIVVFQGWRPSMPTPQSGVKVQRISKEENRIIIYAQFYEPVEGYVQRDIVTSPYHLVKVWKGEDMQGKFEFVLKVDSKEVVRKTHFIP